MEDVNHYVVLGVDPGATSEEIRKAYRAKAANLHPDLHPNDPEAPARFRELNSAYEVLSNTERRRAFDRRFAPITSVVQLFTFHPEGRRVIGAMLPSAPAAAQQGLDAVQVVHIPVHIQKHGGVIVHTLPSGEEVAIPLPKDTRDLSWCRISGQGFPGRNGAPAGDFWLSFTTTQEKP